jgi:hypothetical protein
MRVIIAAFVVGIMLLGVALPAFAQDDGQQYCDWYWGYQFKKAGGWEYWCWHPQLGWWYSQSESGNTRSVTL